MAARTLDDATDDPDAQLLQQSFAYIDSLHDTLEEMFKINGKLLELLQLSYQDKKINATLRELQGELVNMRERAQLARESWKTVTVLHRETAEVLDSKIQRLN